MTRLGKVWGRTLWRGLYEAALFLPVLVLISGFADWTRPGMEAIWLLSFPVVYGISFGIGLRLRLSRLYQMVLLIVSIGILQGYVLLGVSALAAASAAAAAVLAYRGARSASVPWSKLLPLMLQFQAILVYFVASIIMQFIPLFESYLALLNWGGVGALIFFLFNANRQTLNAESFANEDNASIPSSILTQNRGLVAVFMLIVIAVALLSYIREALLWFRDQIAYLFSLIPSGGAEEVPPEQPSQAAGQPLPEAEATPEWMMWLDRLIFYAMYVLIAAAALYVLYLAFRKLPGVIRKLFSWFARMLDRNEQMGEAKGYRDDIESLTPLSSWNKPLSGLLSGWLRRKNAPKWSELATNRERIRFLYRAWIAASTRKGYAFKAHLTPTETASDYRGWKPSDSLDKERLAHLYDGVRYGGESVEDQEIDRLKRMLDG
jgi:hypothetical protein